MADWQCWLAGCEERGDEPQTPAPEPGTSRDSEKRKTPEKNRAEKEGGKSLTEREAALLDNSISQCLDRPISLQVKALLPLPLPGPSRE